MKKSTIIATCLVNQDPQRDIRACERYVQDVFEEDHPDFDFDEWNTDVIEWRALREIERARGATVITVSNFIEMIWDWE